MSSQIVPLSIRFSDALANLYDIAYLTLDIYQVIAFAEALRENDRVAISRWFGKAPTPLTRNSRVLTKRTTQATITDVHRGSIVFDVNGTDLLVQILLYLLTIYVARRDAAHSADHAEEMFSVGVNDPVVTKALDLYRIGQFGTGPDALEKLSEHLAARGRSIEPLGAHAYKIDRVLRRYSIRILHTIKRP
jgi:hypothetical protein